MKREYEALSRLVGRNFAVLDDGNSVYLTPTGAVRDQDGKELLPAFPGRARLYERNLKQGGGASLPDAAPYQQLVTDGDGKWGTADRLAWEEESIEEILPQITFTPALIEEGLMGLVLDFDGQFIEGEVYNVVWDGVDYECQAVYNSSFMILGNSVFLPSDNDTGEPFGVVHINSSAPLLIIAKETEVEHTVRIYQVKKNIHKIPEEYLPVTGSKTPIVNVVFSGVGETFVADKTYAEIAEWVSNGILPVCVLSQSKILYLHRHPYLSDVMPLAAEAHVFIFSGNETNGFYTVRIHDDNYVSVEEGFFALEN